MATRIIGIELGIVGRLHLVEVFLAVPDGRRDLDDVRLLLLLQHIEREAEARRSDCRRIGDRQRPSARRRDTGRAGRRSRCCRRRRPARISCRTILNASTTAESMPDVQTPSISLPEASRSLVVCAVLLSAQPVNTTRHLDVGIALGDFREALVTVGVSRHAVDAAHAPRRFPCRRACRTAIWRRASRTRPDRW